MNYQADCRVQEIPAVWFFLAVFVPFPTRKSLKRAKSIITEHRKNQNKKIYNYLLSLLLVYFLSWGLLSQYRISIILLKKWWEKQKPMKINNNFLTIFEALCVPPFVLSHLKRCGQGFRSQKHAQFGNLSVPCWE